MEIVEIVGFTNNFHDFPNYGSGSRSSSKFMEIVGIVGFTNIFRAPIMEIVGFTNNFHDFPNYGSGSRDLSKFKEIVGIVGLTNIFRYPIMEIVGFTNISKCFVAFGGSPKKLQMFVMLTPAASNDPTGAHDAHPKFAMNRSYVLMRCVFAKWAGKVFASLIKPSSLSSTKLGNNLCLKTLLCEHQFSGFFLSIRNRAILHVYGSRLYYRKTTIAVRTCLCWFNHTLSKIHVQSIYLCHVFVGVCIGGL